MIKLDIKFLGDPALRKSCSPLDENLFGQPSLLKQLRTMKTLMMQTSGIGLAAPQVGISQQIIVIHLENFQKGERLFRQLLLNGQPADPRRLFPLYIINGEIETMSEQQILDSEGCLSLPNLHAYVQRPQAVTLRYRSFNGDTQLLQTNGYLARCIQHEMDHLQGKLYIDYPLFFPQESDRDDFLQQFEKNAQSPLYACWNSANWQLHKSTVAINGRPLFCLQIRELTLGNQK